MLAVLTILHHFHKDYENFRFQCAEHRGLLLVHWSKEFQDFFIEIKLFKCYLYFSKNSLV